jgi:hypothetical protein
MNVSAFRRHALASAAVLALALAGSAHAQLSTSTIQGQVAQGQAPAPAGLAVVAVNKANGNSYRTQTRADGSYVLAGLPPGSYELRVGEQTFAGHHRQRGRNRGGGSGDGRWRRRHAGGGDHRLDLAQGRAQLRSRHQRDEQDHPGHAADHAQLPVLRRPGAGRALRDRRQRRGHRAWRRPGPQQHQHLHRRREPEEQHPARRRFGDGLRPRQPLPAIGRGRVPRHRPELQGRVRPGFVGRHHRGHQVRHERGARRGLPRLHQGQLGGLQPGREGKSRPGQRPRQVHAEADTA